MAVAASPRRVANPSSSSPIASTPMSPSLSTSPVLDMGAASMLWSRRQNVACDGCKMRKIKVRASEEVHARSQAQL